MADSKACEDHHCVLVVDAGSTGSRAHLYAYDLNLDNIPENIHELWSHKIEPGLAMVNCNSASIEAYLSALLTIPLDHHDVPVYFYATAGMRLLTQSAQNEYYQMIRAWFDQQSLWQLMELKTIPGRDEGLYAWLAVAFQSGVLASGNLDALGVIDMGGASVQMVFPIVNDASPLSEHEVQFSLHGQSVRLFSYSVLGLGNNLVRHHFLNDEFCFPPGYMLPNQQVSRGDAETCREHLVNFVNGIYHVREVVSTRTSNVAERQWFVMGGLAYESQSPLFHFEKGVMTTGTLFSQAQNEACHESWSVLDAYYADNKIAFECLNASYYDALLVRGYGLSPDTPLHPFLSQDAEDWTIGVVLLHPS